MPPCMIILFFHLFYRKSLQKNSLNFLYLLSVFLFSLEQSLESMTVIYLSSPCNRKQSYKTCQLFPHCQIQRVIFQSSSYLLLSNI